VYVRAGQSFLDLLVVGEYACNRLRQLDAPPSSSAVGPLGAARAQSRARPRQGHFAETCFWFRLFQAPRRAHSIDGESTVLRVGKSAVGPCARQRAEGRGGKKKGQPLRLPLSCVLVGRVGIEPTTNGLRVRCSTS